MAFPTECFSQRSHSDQIVTVLRSISVGHAIIALSIHDHTPTVKLSPLDSNLQIVAAGA